MNKLTKIEEIVKEYCKNRYLNELIVNEAYKKEGRILWKFHILPVVEHAKYLCKSYQVNPTAVVIGAYFHDITRLDGDDKNHHITSSEVAKKFLLKNRVEAKIIDLVCSAIYEHRGSVKIPKSSMASSILASADGFALISNIHLLFYSAFRKNNLTIVPGTQKVLGKINRSSEKLLPESKAVIDKLYGDFIVQLGRCI